MDNFCPCFCKILNKEKTDEIFVFCTKRWEYWMIYLLNHSLIISAILLLPIRALLYSLFPPIPRRAALLFPHSPQRSPRPYRSNRNAWLLSLVILSTFLFPPKKRGEKKRGMNRKNCDQNMPFCWIAHIFPL